MITDIITWMFLGIFALFIVFKFKKFLPFKQDNRSVNYYHTEQHPVTRNEIIREIRTVKRSEIEDEYDDNGDSVNYDDIWNKTLQDDADIANELFGVKKSGDNY